MNRKHVGTVCMSTSAIGRQPVIIIAAKIGQRNIRKEIRNVKNNSPNLKYDEYRFYNQSLRETVNFLKTISSVPPKTYGEMLLSKRHKKKRR